VTNRTNPPNRSGPRSILTVAAALATAALLGTTACGAGSETAADDQVATLSDGTTGSDPDPGAAAGSDQSDSSNPFDIAEVAGIEAPEDPEEAFRLYNTCMTEAGFDGGSMGIVTDAPSGVEIELEDEADPQLADDFDVEAFEAADVACQPHLANAFGDFEVNPEQEAAMRDADLAFSRCMQEAGFEIDLTDDGFVDDSGADEDFDFEAYDAATTTCVTEAYENNPALDDLFGQEDNQ
jgi:hypothetical protein